MLLTANQFEDRTVGYSGASSRLVEAYCTLLREPTAGIAFKDLVERATLPGRLYALCGLYFTDTSYFRLVVQEYRQDSRQIAVQSGCIITSMSLSNLIEAKEPIVVDPSDPDKSLSDGIALNTALYTEWSHRKKKAKDERSPECYDLDILNGGYPFWFKCKGLIPSS